MKNRKVEIIAGGQTLAEMRRDIFQGNTFSTTISSINDVTYILRKSNKSNRIPSKN